MDLEAQDMQAWFANLVTEAGEVTIRIWAYDYDEGLQIADEAARALEAEWPKKGLWVDLLSTKAPKQPGYTICR